MISVTSVVRNGRVFRKPIRKPLMLPSAAPTASVAAITRGPGAPHEQEVKRREIAEREDRAHAQVDAAADEAKSHRERDEAELGKQPQQRQRVLHRGVVGNGQREIDPQPDHHREGNDRLEPLLQ